MTSHVGHPCWPFLQVLMANNFAATITAALRHVEADALRGGARRVRDE
jgi:hypothetical protein